MEGAEFTGDDLLDLFDTLGIELGNLNTNVIKGWFDTDCKETKDCLKWMCASITDANLLNAQEAIESSELQTFLVDHKYESSLAATEEKFPGIFDDPAEVELEIELLEDEKQLYSDELNNLENIISIQEKIHEAACNDLHKLTNEEITVKLALDKAKQNCESLAQKLDTIELQLHEQISCYASYLCDFEFSSEPQFIHNMPVCTCEENFHLISGYLNAFLKRECGDLVGNLTDDKSVFSANSFSNLGIERINGIKNRIFDAKHRYLMEKLKAEEMQGVMQMLRTCNVNYSPSLLDCAQLEMNIESKNEQMSVLMERIQSTCMKQAEYEVSQPTLSFAQKELAAQQLKLENSKNLLKNCSRLLAIYLEMKTMFLQEHKDIIASDEFFKEVLKYITKDLHMCMLRTEAMSQVIEDFNHFDAKPVVHKLKIVDEIMKHMVDKRDYDNIEESTLMKAVSLKNDLKDQVLCMKQQIYYKDFDLHRKHSKGLKGEIAVLNNFLKCGPTSRIEVVPSRLLNIFREIDAFMEHQNIAVKSIVDIIGGASKTLSNEKWLNARRHLWMYFLNDRTKLFAILKSIEDEYNNLKVTT